MKRPAVSQRVSAERIMFRSPNAVMPSTYDIERNASTMPPRTMTRNGTQSGMTRSQAK